MVVVALGEAMVDDGRRREPQQQQRTARAGRPAGAGLGPVVLVALLAWLLGASLAPVVAGAAPAGAAPDGTHAAPTITSVAPKRGNPDGGTPFTVTGTGFTGATAVHVGLRESGEATDVVVVDDTTLTAVTPPGDGWFNVYVTTPQGRSAKVDPTTWFQYEPRPRIDGLVPTTGLVAGGEVVTIDGNVFDDVTEVWFGDQPAAAFTVVDATTIVATTPPHPAGPVRVRVVSATGGTSLDRWTDDFTYAPPAVPTVTALSPAGGPDEGGTVVDVTGSGFTGATAVRFGSANPATSFTVLSDTHLRAVAPSTPVPATPLTTVNVVVDTPAGTSTSAMRSWYRYQSVPPTITDVAPPTGPPAGGTTVTLTGTGLRFVTAVTVDGVAVDHTVVDETTIELVTPTPSARGVPGSAAAGPVEVAVTAWGGTATATFTFAAPVVPRVTSLSPRRGPITGGTVVDIHGTDLDVATGVRFGQVPAASFTVHSPTHISAVTAPAPAPSSVGVYVEAPQGTSTANTLDQFFRYEGPPVVTSLTPASGPTSGGTSVQLQGSGFTGATAVRFGGVDATSFTVHDQFGLTAVAPPHAAGTVDVVVVTPLGTGAASPAARFTYAAVAVPHITSLSPITGPVAGGTVVTITGTGFTGATVVRFGAATPALSFTVVDDTRIEATAPPAGAPALVSVFVDGPGGSTAAAPRSWFRYA